MPSVWHLQSLSRDGLWNKLTVDGFQTPDEAQHHRQQIIVTLGCDPSKIRVTQATTHEWVAVWRLDRYEEFATNSGSYHLTTTDLAEAAEEIQRELGSNVTLIELKRVI
jgi:hypothetical protein